MKQRKKIVSIVAVVAFLVMALAPVAALAADPTVALAPADSSSNITETSGAYSATAENTAIKVTATITDANGDDVTTITSPATLTWTVTAGSSNTAVDVSSCDDSLDLEIPAASVTAAKSPLKVKAKYDPDGTDSEAVESTEMTITVGPSESGSSITEGSVTVTDAPDPWIIGDDTQDDFTATLAGVKADGETIASASVGADKDYTATWGIATQAETDARDGEATYTFTAFATQPQPVADAPSAQSSATITPAIFNAAVTSMVGGDEVYVACAVKANDASEDPSVRAAYADETNGWVVVADAPIELQDPPALIDSVVVAGLAGPEAGGSVGPADLPEAASITVKAGDATLTATDYTAQLTWGTLSGTTFTPASEISDGESYVPRIVVSSTDPEKYITAAKGTAPVSYAGTATINGSAATGKTTNATASANGGNVTIYGAALTVGQEAPNPTLSLAAPVQTVDRGTTATVVATIAGITPSSSAPVVIDWSFSGVAGGCTFQQADGSTADTLTSSVTSGSTATATIVVPAGTTVRNVTVEAAISGAGPDGTSAIQLTINQPTNTTPSNSPSASASQVPASSAPANSASSAPVVPSQRPDSGVTTPSANPSAAPSGSASVAPSGSASAAPSSAASSAASAPITLKPDASNAPADLAVVSNPDGAGTILTGVPISTPSETVDVQTLTTWVAIPEGGSVEVLNSNGQPAAASDPIATGMIVEVLGPDGSVVQRTVVVVKGDVTGSGEINLTQLVRLAAAYVGREPLSGVYEAAADLNGDGAVNLTDLVIEARMYKDAGSPDAK